MYKAVKEFVEDNINLIEGQEWMLLFLEWYDFPYKEFPDTTQFKELMAVLTACYPDIYKETESARTLTITVEVARTINNMKTPNSGWFGNDVFQEVLVQDLNSTLGLSKEELIQCIDSAAASEDCYKDIDEEGHIFYRWP